jgi:MOSC domain-containing protein YiiM
VSGRIIQLSVSPGGVPKLPVGEVHVGRTGLEGDSQNDRDHHGGPDRAVCLYSVERIEQLQAEGHPITPGSAGENVTISGLDWAAIRPGARVLLGESVELEVTGYTTPCHKIRDSFVEGGFTRISQKLRPGDSRVYARVLRDGRLRVGDSVALLAAASDER